MDIEKHYKLKHAAMDLVSYHENQIKILQEMLVEAQARCKHDWEFYAEGRHGSDKGTRYYRCWICSVEREE